MPKLRDNEEGSLLYWDSGNSQHLKGAGHFTKKISFIKEKVPRTKIICIAWVLTERSHVLDVFSLICL